MIKKYSKTIAILALLLLTSIANAEQALIVGIGKGMDNTLIQSHPISNVEQTELSWAYKLEDVDELAEWGLIGHFEWWFQAGYAHLSGAHFGDKVTNHIAQIKPILRWYPNAKAGQLFYEAGVGVAYLSKKDFKQIHMPTTLNFAVHAAAGWKFSDLMSLSLRYSHFSNGYINTPNPGLDYMSLNLHWAF